MGYTHYWQRSPQLPHDAFGRAVADCQRALPPTHVPLAGANGNGQPRFKSDAIVFNGVGIDAHETFAIRLSEPERSDGRPAFLFCKTEHKPYDLAVQVALIVFKHHLGEAFHVSSDGAEADWDTARELCQHHLGYGADFQLDKG